MATKIGIVIETEWTMETRIWEHDSLNGQPDFKGQERVVLIDPDGFVYGHYATEEEAHEAVKAFYV